MKVQAKAVAPRTLWPSRLGHPSSQVLTMLPKHLAIDSCSENNKVHVCDVCLRAKQTKV